MSEGVGSPKKAETLGEELWEVHLSRENDANSDVDVVHSPRVNSMTAGEELWRIHCTRAGGDLDKDYDDKDIVAPREQATSTEGKKVISLRNREVEVPQE